MDEFIERLRDLQGEARKLVSKYAGDGEDLSAARALDTAKELMAIELDALRARRSSDDMGYWGIQEQNPRTPAWRWLSDEEVYRTRDEALLRRREMELVFKGHEYRVVRWEEPR